MENISIREATLEDNADVIDIHDDVYDGRDYLASRYEEFLTCPNTTSFVALANDKIVAFLAMLLIDGGQTMVSRAGRSSPAVAKQGVYKKLNAHAQQEARKCGVTINALTTGNMNQAIYTDSFRMQYKEILKKTIVRFLVDIQTVPIPNTDDDVTLLHEPDDKEIVSYFVDENTRSYLFPKDRIICSWVPYKLLASNLWHMRSPGTNKRVTSDVRVDDNGRARGLFTISSTFACVDPPYFIDLDIHGTDTNCLKQHILTHFQFARKIATGTVSVLVYMEPEFNKTELVKAFAEMGINESPWSINGVELNEEILFENESR